MIGEDASHWQRCHCGAISWPQFLAVVAWYDGPNWSRLVSISLEWPCMAPFVPNWPHWDPVWPQTSSFQGQVDFNPPLFLPCFRFLTCLQTVQYIIGSRTTNAIAYQSCSAIMVYRSRQECLPLSQGILCFGPHIVPVPANVPHFWFQLYPGVFDNNLKYDISVFF